MNRHENNY